MKKCDPVIKDSIYYGLTSTAFGPHTMSLDVTENERTYYLLTCMFAQSVRADILRYSQSEHKDTLKSI